MSCLLLIEAKILPLLVELGHRTLSTKKPAQRAIFRWDSRSTLRYFEVLLGAFKYFEVFMAFFIFLHFYCLGIASIELCEVVW